MSDSGGGNPASRRIVKIELDERSIVRRNPDIEHERAVAIVDLLESNHFVALAAAERCSGPYELGLSIEEDRLVFDIRDGRSAAIDRVALTLKPFRQVVKDYFLVCESYYSAIKTAPPSQIEAIDMGRRSLHNEGADKLREALEGRIDMDRDTARRLFTLVCVLHIRA